MKRPGKQHARKIFVAACDRVCVLRHRTTVTIEEEGHASHHKVEGRRQRQGTTASQMDPPNHMIDLNRFATCRVGRWLSCVG